MQTELLSLSKIFTERLFRIPDYQRGYSWSDRQLKDFWSDIVLLDDGRDHYTGVLTLEQVSPAGYAGWTDDAWIINSKRYAPFYVVDGQQRLTTALILLQAILEKSGIAELNYTTTDEIRKKFIFETRDKGVSRSYIFGYEKDNPSYEFLKTRIFDERSDDHNIGEETIYTHNLTRAKSFFLTQIATLAPDDIAKIYTKLTQHFLFNIYTISADIDVFVAFETMNNRGKPLSNLELLKNRLIFLSTRLGVDATERQKVRSTVNESWKTAYHYLGRNQLEPIRDDLFLMIQCAHYYCSSLFSGGLMDSAGYRHTLRMMQNDEEYFKQYLLETVFTSRNIGRGSDGKVSSSSIYEYAHDLKKSVHVLYEILNPHDSKFTDEQKVLLAKLNRLASHEVAYLTLVFAAVIRSRKEDLTRFLREFERLLFFFSFGAFRGDGTRAVFEPVKLVVSMRKDGASLDDACAQIADYADFCAKELATSVLISERSARGYYTWRGVRYFLFEYEDSLRLKAKAKREKIRWDDFTREDFDVDYHTVEHVFPQRPERGAWPAFARFKASRKSAMCNSLGNLVALSRPKNSQLGNHSFLSKRDGQDGNSGYRVGSYSELEIAKVEDWTPDAILERGIRMLGFLEKRWRVTIGDESAKARALNLGFLLEASAPVKPRSPKR